MPRASFQACGLWPVACNVRRRIRGDQCRKTGRPILSETTQPLNTQTTHRTETPPTTLTQTRAATRTQLERDPELCRIRAPNSPWAESGPYGPNPGRTGRIRAVQGKSGPYGIPDLIQKLFRNPAWMQISFRNRFGIPLGSFRNRFGMSFGFNVPFRSHLAHS